MWDIVAVWFCLLVNDLFFPRLGEGGGGGGGIYIHKCIEKGKMYFGFSKGENLMCEHFNGFLGS